MKALSIAVAAFLLASCASVSTYDGKPIQQALAEAQAVATSADRIGLSLGSTITVKQEKAVRDAARVVFSTVHTARAVLNGGDPAAAQALLKSIQNDVATLLQFLADQGAKP